MALVNGDARNQHFLGLPAPRPPAAWSFDGQGGIPGSDENISRSQLMRDGVVDAHDAWKHCKDVSRDDARRPDLYDLLSHSVRETQYSFPPPGWPAQVRMVSPVVNEMPKMVMERYAMCQTVAFCGVFPEIRRAWASVDSALFLWRYDRWQDVPIEYNGQDQAIVAAGVIVPRRAVFQEAIQHLIVLCTTTEIHLIGVCHSGDEFEEITLQSLPQYTISTDNISMISVAGSTNGRIFLGGSDGNVYEIKYEAKDTWRSKRCTKINHTRGIRGYLPSFLPSSIFGQPQPIVHIAIDNDRHILYTRTQNSVITVYDLGLNGKDAPNRVAETSDFAVDASRALGGREVFGRGAGDKKGARVVYMSPIPPSTSRRVHLLTVTADGRRVYWSTMSSRPSMSNSQIRPDRLKAEVARRAVPMPTSGRSLHSGAGRSLDILAACAASDTLILAESVPNESRTSLFVISRDTTIPPAGTATGAHVSIPGLRESVDQLEFPLPGEACVVRQLQESSTEKLNLGILSQDLQFSASQRFAIATTAGVAQIELLRPTETLSQILVDNNKSALELFFFSYGAPEACAMCIQLAAGMTPSSKVVASYAEAALENQHLCGQPELRIGSSNEMQDEEPAAHLSGGFDMGAVVPITEPEWSASHKGLCLVVSRILRGIWDEPLFSYSSSAPDVLKCTLSSQTLAYLANTLQDLEDFLGKFIQKKKTERPRNIIEAQSPLKKRQRLEDALRAELQRTEQIRALVTRVSHGCHLLLLLSERNISRLSARLETGARHTVRSLRFRDWVSLEEGDTAASQLIAALVSVNLNEEGEFSHDLAVKLQQSCPSYFKDTDRRYYDARSLLRKAEGATSVADRSSITREAMSLLLKVPLACDLAQVIPQLAMLREIGNIVELTVRKANALDPTNSAAEDDSTIAQEARMKRNDFCYVHVCDLLRVLKSPVGIKPPASLEAFAKSLSGEEKNKLSQELIAKTATSEDPFFQENIYKTLIDLNCIQDLLNMESDTLEHYLFQESGLGATLTGALAGPLSAEETTHAEVLSKYYIKTKEYAASAGVLEHLASQIASVVEPPQPSLEKRVQYLESAVLQARSCGDASLVDRLSTKARLGHIQIELEQIAMEKNLLAQTEGDNGAITEISRSLLSLEILYNDIARKFNLWKQCLELIDVASYDQSEYVRQLWDLYMTSEWRAVWEESLITNDSERCFSACQIMCEACSALGRTFYPNESSLPLVSIIIRMEQAAHGMWPEQIASLDTDATVEIVRKNAVAICADSYEAAVNAYESIMAIRSCDPLGQEVHEPELRFRILCTVKDIVDDALNAGLVNETNNPVERRRMLASLASACEIFAAESRQSPHQAGDRLGDEFDTTRMEIERQMKQLHSAIF